jgi:hypothetical protein
MEKSTSTELDIHGSVHHDKIFTKINQQDATV